MTDLITYQGDKLAGVDEVGRGPLVGAVVTAAVMLDPARPIAGLMDSKKLSEKKREALYSEILEKARCWSVGRAEAEEIDQINILQATLVAMKRAVDGLTVTPEFVVVDGNRLPDWSYSAKAIIKGDGLLEEISAASIVAKVTRDREMKLLAERFPEYGFDAHKGYPTKAHLEAIRRHGICPQHRRSFKPVKEYAE